MQIHTIIRVLGLLVMIFSFSMVPPIFIAEWYHDGAEVAFIASFVFTIVTGFLLWLPFRNEKKDFKTRDGFLIVVLFWSVLALFGAIPLILSASPHVSFTDAVFESVSGLTTTGTSVLPDLDHLPHAIRYYRQQMQFLGGMGIVVLAVAILPMLGVGGMQLYRAETPGPMKDTKLTPRIAETAKALWYIYIGLVIICAGAYWLSGMTLFDAIGESFGTISTGGFSTHTDSFAFYDSAKIELIASFFMLISAFNYALHFIAIQRRTLKHYLHDIELRTYVFILVAAIGITIFTLTSHHVYSEKSTTIVKAIFNVVSLATTTGFTSTSFSTWPTFLPIFIMVLGIIGGCAASTAGGLKVIRLTLLLKQGAREIKRLIHPKAVYSIKFGNVSLPERVSQAIWGFIAIFGTLFVVLILLLMATGLDFTTAFGAVVACISNCGAGIGGVSGTFNHLAPFAKWCLIFAMLAGRLEIFTLIILFTPAFWQR